ncbi:MAG: alpha-2-macroglobulin family protein [Cytophagaceae bacterium]
MTISRILRLIPIAVLALLFSCSDKSAVKLTDRNFGEEIDLQQNLMFIFNNDLIPDSLIDLWEAEELIKFTPEVKGKFKWSSRNELIFSPDLGFLPSTDYTAELTSKIVSHKSGLSLDKGSPINFHTPYLKLSHINTYWARKEGTRNEAEARIELNFNCRINPNELKDLIQLQVAGKNLNFELKEFNPTNVVLASVAESGNKLDDATVLVRIKKGLKCADSKYATKDEMSMESRIPSKDQFQIIKVEALYEEDSPYIYIETNQEVSSENLNNLIKITPRVSFTTENVSSGITVKGDFQTGEAYVVTINKYLKGIFGGSLKEDYEQTIVFGNQEPHISFVSNKGMYLSSKGEKNLGVRIINVPKVQISVTKIYANNILHYLNSGSNYYFDDYDYDYGYDYYNLGNYGDEIMNKEVASSSLKKVNGISYVNLNLNDNSEYKGIYMVMVNSSESRWMKATKLISLSDIGLIVKETENDILVFANSILNTKPVDGAEITLVSSNNQSVYKAVTDKEGVAKFEDVKKKAPGFRIRMVAAIKDNDFNFLNFNQARVETSRYEVGGIRNNPSGYQAYIYGDRDIYRPGETINVNNIIRSESWQPVKDIPVKMKLIMPSGKEFASYRGNLNEEGAYTCSFNLPVSAVTGTYNLELYSGNDVLLNSKSVSVEEFMPDRIKVNAEINKEQVKLNDQLKLTGEALNLFGPPAANRNYEADMSLRRKYYRPKGYDSYTFDIQGKGDFNIENVLKEGSTDDDGKFSETFSFASALKNSGVYEGKIFVTVFDESGRPVNRIKKFDLHTQDVYFGLKLDNYYYSTSDNVVIPIVAVDANGIAQKTQATVQIIKYDWQTVLEKSYNGYRYVSQKKQRILEEKQISIGSNTSYTFRPVQSGEYEVRVLRSGTDSYVSRHFYSYGYGSTTYNSFEVNKEGNVDITTDKPIYNTGEEATLLFKTPFDGKVIVTIERDKVFDYFVVNTDKRTGTLKLKVKEEYLPNVYISATVIKPSEDVVVPLTVGHGYQPLLCEKKENILPVEIKAPASSRSNTRQDICIKTKADSDIQVTVAVVDEGILQLKNMKSPDPYSFFYQKRALEVRSYDLYPDLLPELKSGRSSVAGDGYDLERRVNPLSNKRVKLVSFWSGILKTNGKGEACYPVDIPKFSGDLRIMVVAYQGSAFGSASTNMKVADPLVVSTSMPRFLSPGDTLLMPVTLTNTTGNQANASASLVVEGPVQIVGLQEQKVNIRSNGEAQVKFKLIAKAEMGEAKVKTVVKALNEEFTEEIDITVRPVTSLVKQSGADKIKAGSTGNINLNADYISGSGRANLVISKSPLVQFASSLDYLIGYPHGCVEQTISKSFPQIYVAEIGKAINVNNKSPYNAAYFVQEGINKLNTMQMYNGSLAYWPGGGYENWWATVYGAHFLTEARKAGYDVKNDVLEKIYGYLQSKVKEKRTEEYYYYDNNNKLQVKKIAPKEIFYSLYVLAAAGKQDLSIMNYYKSNLHLLSVDSKYMLAATYLSLGDKATFTSMLPGGFGDEKSRNSFSGSFYSYVRDMGISLNALIENDPDNPQIPVLAKHLSEQVRNAKWLNTQENAFALIALGKLARKANASGITAEIKADGKKIADFTESTMALNKGLFGKSVTVATKGTGELYYFYETSGLTAGEVKEEDNYIKVRKTFYDRNGRVLTGNTFTQNDLVVIKVTVSTTDNSRVDNVVITDMLPAGFEIENPRLSEGADLPWITAQNVPEHLDIRDDRINIYTPVSGTQKTFYYMVRAVSTGTFKMGPVSADAMYNGEYHSYNGAGVIRIVEKGKPGL